MIIYGLTMQGKPEEIPKEVAIWLIERNSRYPNIDFTIDCWNPHPSQAEEFESLARKYSRIFSLNAPFKAVLSVIFPYLKQSWNIKIVGGLNRNGGIADRSKDRSKEGVVQPLSPELRAEIAGLNSNAEKIGEEAMGIPRKENESPLEKPSEMVSFPPDFRWTSEFSLSGEEEFNKFLEFAGLLNNSQVKDEAERAIRKKDWETLKRLKEKFN